MQGLHLATIITNKPENVENILEIELNSQGGGGNYENGVITHIWAFR